MLNESIDGSLFLIHTGVKMCVPIHIFQILPILHYYAFLIGLNVNLCININLFKVDYPIA
jgi:hypothetical protein